jgi:hypothetical protein
MIQFFKIYVKPAFTISIVATSILLGFNNLAFAYSEETHRDETNIMLIHAGIHPAIADNLSKYAQWVDESRLNSALNPVPVFHARVSRLMHFPTEGVDFLQAAINDATNVFVKTQHISGGGHGNIQNSFNVAQRNSMIANEIFNEALKTGNPYLMGAALHVLMDSFAHEGFDYIIGHGERGHYPDRPWMFVEKHNEMRKLLFQAMARIREALPPEALSDIHVNIYGKANRELSPTELYTSYVAQSEIVKATAAVPHSDPLYTGEAVDILLSKLIGEGIAQPAIKEFIFIENRGLFFNQNSDNGDHHDAWGVMKEVIAALYALPVERRQALIDITRLESTYASVPNGDLIFIGDNGQEIRVKRNEIIDSNNADIPAKILYSLAHRLIPRPALGDTDSNPGAKDTFEDERLVQVEARIQRARWQEIGYRIYGIAPVLLVKTSIGNFLKQLQKDIGTNGLRLENDLKQLDMNVAGNQVLSSMTLKERAAFAYALFKYTILDFITYRLTHLLTRVHLMSAPRGNLRLVDADVPDAKLWQTDQIFSRLRQAGFFKQLYSAEKAAGLISKWNQRNSDFAEARAQLDGGSLDTPLGQLNRLRSTYRTEAGLSANSGFTPTAHISCQGIFAQ